MWHRFMSGVRPAPRTDWTIEDALNDSGSTDPVPDTDQLQGDPNMDDTMPHPDYYGQHPSGIECWAIAEGFGFNLGNAIKYVWRSGLKPGADPIQDLEKAVHYLQREIANRRCKVLSATAVLPPAVNQ